MDDTSDALALAPEGLKLPAFDQTPEQMSAGRRAVLELDLQDVRRLIEATVVARNSANDMAVETSSLADEHRIEGRHTLARSYAASSIAWRSRVIVLNGELHSLRAREQELLSMLKTEAARSAPVVLTRDQVEGADDMAFSGVAA